MSIAYLEGASFDSFVEGPSNRAAVAAARAVADRASGYPNPLLITGAAGLGKSHLLAAIAAQARARDPAARVEVETTAGLRQRLQGARGGVQPLHECALLLLDELEGVTGSPDLEALVLELLLGRVPFGRPVVLAGNWNPERPGEADPDLVRSVAEGTTVAVGAPDPGTRLAILRRRAADLTPALPDEVLTVVAGLPIASVRELLAAIQRLVSFQAVSPTPLTAADARLLITGLADSVADEGAPAGPAAPDPVSAPPLAVGDDEFSSFLSEVVASVGHQMDRWRAQLGETILRLGGEGFRTRRLEALLEQERPAGGLEALEEFTRDVAQLRALEAEAASLDPSLAGAAPFRDPDRLDEAAAILAQARMRRDPLPAPSPDFRLERFAEGPGNRQALQAVRNLAQQTGERFNPLVLVGASGTGKSHLLHGLGHHLAARLAGPVACVAAGTLVGEVGRLSAVGMMDGWRARWRHAAALLVDDIHLLARHPEAQAEFLDLFAHLVGAGHPVVVTSSHPPAELREVDPRLLTRLEAGLVVDLPRPDREIRLAVAKQLLAGTPGEGDAALSDWFAARRVESVRALQGALHRVLSAAEAQGVAPSPALAREVLDRREPGSRRSASHLATGMPGPTHRLSQSPEKMVIVWPRVADRLIEDLS
jgi:chromosomal replication initiation ATPase DnaA